MVSKSRVDIKSRGKRFLKKVYYAFLELLLRAGANRLVFILSEMTIDRLQSETDAGVFWLRSRDAINGTTVLPDMNHDLRTRFCSRPFEWLEIGAKDLHLCCSAWLPTPIGSSDDPVAAWSGESAEKIRRSILDKSFRYCSRLYCPYIVKGTLPFDNGVVPQTSARPRIINLSYDFSCNLSCPSCRTRPFVANSAERAGLDNYYSSKVAPLLSSGSVVNVTGSGDPFASKHFRSVLRDLAARHGVMIDLQTNGNLFDRRAWEDLSLSGSVRRVRVSLDAATEHTYSYVRRGGRFARVLENLAFLMTLRASGQIDFPGIDVVLQARNIDEVPGIIEMARTIGVDKIRFNTIRNWGTYSAKEFQKESIHSAMHGNRARFEEVYRSGIFSDPIVDQGNIRQAIGLYSSNIDDDHDVGHA
jgi:MoaA/NifB/PqqE/SkfB family radical SAM enzyme